MKKVENRRSVWQTKGLHVSSKGRNKIKGKKGEVD